VQIAETMRIVAFCAVMVVSQVASADGHPEFAVRGGIHSTEMAFDDDAPAGKGPIVDGEGGWRFNDWLSVDVWSAYAYLHDTINDPFSSAKKYDIHDHMLEVGARLSFHVHGAFGGMGLGRLEYRETADNGMTRWWGGTIAELHAGYTFPKIDRFAFEILASASLAEVQYDGKVGTVRLVAGVRL
jgi:outer membrane protein with beta-barrel domain